MSVVSYKRISNTFLETEINREIIVKDTIPLANRAEREAIPAIEFDNVYFSYNTNDASPYVIESLSFKVMPQEKV